MKTKNKHGRKGVRAPKTDQIREAASTRTKQDELNAYYFESGWKAGKEFAQEQADAFLKELSNCTNISAVRNKITRNFNGE